MSTCYKCKTECSFKDDKTLVFGSLCDICTNVTCAECAGISPTEVRVLILKNRALFHICPDCKTSFLKNTMEQNKRIAVLEEEVKQLRANHTLVESVQQKINTLEIDAKCATKNNARVEELMNRVKYMEKNTEVSQSNTKIYSKINELETTLSNTIINTLNKHLDTLKLDVTNLSKTFERNATELRNSITTAIEEKGKAYSNLEHCESHSIPGISHNQLSEAIIQAETYSKLNEYINLGKESANSKESFNSTSKEKKKVVKGSNKNIAEIAAAEECKWIYIGNLNSKSTEDQLKQYLISKDIEVYSVAKLSHTDQQRDMSCSFKVSVSLKDESSIFNSNLWPENVVVKHFNFHTKGKFANKFNNYGNFRLRQQRNRPRK